jgi:hypothetical protein
MVTEGSTPAGRQAGAVRRPSSVSASRPIAIEAKSGLFPVRLARRRGTEDHVGRIFGAS